MEKKTSQFKAEIAEMLDLVVNSLYSKKEIFLRELVSNASDAIDKAKFQGLTDKALVADNPEWKIEIAVDSAAKTMMISDNGIGMDAAELCRDCPRKAYGEMDMFAHLSEFRMCICKNTKCFTVKWPNVSLY